MCTARMQTSPDHSVSDSEDLADHAAEAEVPHPEGQGDGEDYEESVHEPSACAEEEEEEQERPREFAKCEFEAPPDMARLVFAAPLHNNSVDEAPRLNL